MPKNLDASSDPWYFRINLFQKVQNMRCKACDKALTDFEATRKFTNSCEYVDLCSDCFSHLKDLDVDERPELQKEWERPTQID